MTQEQFKRALELNVKLCELNRVKEEIKNTIKHRLSYIEKQDREFGFSGPDWKPCNVNYLAVIGHILDRHDKQIRQEIEEEIDKLIKEIEAL